MSGFEPYLALEASAGSGKTYALSVRYISLLYLGARATSILTLTFTNKAASEMKSRICEVLLNLENRGELEEICKLTGFSKEYLLKNKSKILEGFLKDDLLISTIDSFFAKVLRKFSLYSGLMPDFTTEDRLLQKWVLHKFLSLCIAKNRYESLVNFCINEEKKVGDIFGLLDSFYAKESEFEGFSLARRGGNFEKEILKVAKELKEITQKSGASKSAIKTFDVESFEELYKKPVFEKESLKEHHYFKKYFCAKMDERFFELKSLIKKEMQVRESYLLSELFGLFEIYKEAILKTNKELNRLSFSDVTNILYNLLKDEIRSDFLYFRLDSRCEHILIDEFQDTSTMQYRILEPLFNEAVAGFGASEFRSLFCVGDIKQSIYRFRGGAKELFGYVKERYNLKKESLDTNYRSSRHVVDFVNSTFEHKIKGYEIQHVNSDVDGFVSIISGEKLLELVKDELKRLLKSGASPKDIAILTHQNKDALAIKLYLEEQFKEIAFQNEANLLLVETKTIKAIIDLLKYAYFGDKLYRCNFLVAIGKQIDCDLDVGFVDFDLPLVTLVRKIIEEFGLFCNDMDLIKFLEVCSTYSSIESFLFECDELGIKAKEEDNEGVKILTIHKSKGLEFESVIVVDRLGEKNNKSSPLIFEYNSIELVGVYKRVKNREFLDESYKRAVQKEKILEDEDRLNLHYVAFTRAKNNLLVVKKIEKSIFDYLELKDEVIGKIYVEDKKFEPNRLHSANIEIKNYGKQELKLKQEESEEIDFFAIEYGLALHYCLEMMSEFKIDSLDVAYKAMLNRYAQNIGEQACNSIYKRVENLIKNEEFRELVDGKRLSKEQPLIYNNERKQIDLLCEDEDEIVIIDYKSSNEVQDKHIAQVGLYKSAIEEISFKMVKAYLVYLREDGIELLKI